MKKFFAFALCAAILGACAAPAWAQDASGNTAGKTVKKENAGKVSSKKKKTKKSHKKKKKGSGGKKKSASKGRKAAKA
jgi:hypothetical protein